MGLLPWRESDRTLEYACEHFRIEKRECMSPTTGQKHHFYTFSTSDWVNVVALTAGRDVVLVSQWRYGSGRVGLEVPGGAIDARDADPLAAAKRELREETGYGSDSWFPLGIVEPNPAVMTNRTHCFLALDARRTFEPSPDPGEELEVSLAQLDSIPERVMNGKISHALVVCAFYLLERFRAENPGLFSGPNAGTGVEA